MTSAPFLRTVIFRVHSLTCTLSTLRVQPQVDAGCAQLGTESYVEEFPLGTCGQTNNVSVQNADCPQYQKT